jgi:hypothetical protein
MVWYCSGFYSGRMDGCIVCIVSDREIPEGRMDGLN